MTALTTPKDLLSAGLIDETALESAERVAARYAISLTDDVARLIDPADAKDPIARQYLPRLEELTILPGEREDPIGDHAHAPVAGIVHRYPDRVLLKAVHVCPVYCRFCFRREMVGPAGDGMLAGESLDGALDYIAHHPEIWEVIITGGDPLVLSPRRLASLMQRLGGIDHVKIIRFHSRVPVVDSGRIDEGLIEALRASGKTVYVALHANHAREFTPEAKAAVDRLISGGVTMVSQSVLLKGVNDSVEALEALMRGFVEMRVKPYYLHHPDLAPGTSHFRLGIDEGRTLVEALRRRVSGLCMPAYILDVPGGSGKVPLTESPVMAVGEGGYEISDRHGETHVYRDEA
ncbi:lysine-2,3-aminomutase-like protein [Rhizobium sp. TRM95796]|uniref:lysine-2,3-aminomutase-like protein n=1 Tax=Rhizobium sp. TRM95796 TaxID=2979862 RepID=UPI0021E95EDB|nr:lysine-2,3-aminomutase-like protein [Rhizobium sp. TRM95796]MCV3764671.1 lysine-2,3-aminomutase-like protein [Rhizobium sp. TRM95796]